MLLFVRSLASPNRVLKRPGESAHQGIAASHKMSLLDMAGRVSLVGCGGPEQTFASGSSQPTWGRGGLWPVGGWVGGWVG